MKYLIEIKAEHDRDLGGDEKTEIRLQLERVLEDRGFDQIDGNLNNQPAGMTLGTIFRMPMGKINLGPNGWAVISTELDPAESWLVSQPGQKILGFLGGGIDRGDGRFIQVAQVQIGLDDRFSQPTGLIKFLLLDPRLPGPEDKQMMVSMAFAVDGPWFSGTPRVLGSPGSPR